MPYNTTPIEPGNEPTGTANLPLARTKKIISADDDISACSANAAFAITIATELFIQHLVTQTHNVLKLERKPRRQVAYKDVATTVAKHDNLEFLTDVVPRTVTYKVFKGRKVAAKARDGGVGGSTLAVRGKGQTTLAQMSAGGSRNGTEKAPNGDVEMDDADNASDNNGEPSGTESAEAAGVGVLGSPRSVRSVGTRYDAVRNGFDGGGRVEKHLPMEED